MDLFNRKKIAKLEALNKQLIEALEFNRQSLNESTIIKLSGVVYHKFVPLTTDEIKNNVMPEMEIPHEDNFKVMLNAWSKIASSISWSNGLLDDIKQK